MMKGFKTFATGFVLAVLPQAITFLTGFDFEGTFHLSPNVATIIGLVMIGLRAATSTPMFRSQHPGGN